MGAKIARPVAARATGSVLRNAANARKRETLKKMGGDILSLSIDGLANQAQNSERAAPMVCMSR